MAAPATIAEFLARVTKSALLDPQRLDGYLHQLRTTSTMPAKPQQLADAMLRDGLLTRYQAEQLLLGQGGTFTVSSKYRILERLGAGGMASVYLCEHMVMRRRVALKVLPPALAEDPSALGRFHREARAVAALDHPNIVRAYDIDRDGKLHFLVMEYVDGSSLQEIVKRHGRLDLGRSAHYIRQAAQGLQHAHSAGLVHRDIKPANLLLDRQGTVKVLDMGLARFFHDEADNLTHKYHEAVLGTADYMAPEQTLDSHAVDIRADIYSLGITWYFLLTGKSPFGRGTVTQKLLWHQMKQPEPIAALRPEVPDALGALISRMIAKEPAGRYQTPAEVVAALASWTQTPIPPPPKEEMPRLSRAALGCAQTEVRRAPPPTVQRGAAGGPPFGEGALPVPGESLSPTQASAPSTQEPLMAMPVSVASQADEHVGPQTPQAEPVPASTTAWAMDDPTVSARAGQRTSETLPRSRNHLLIGAMALAAVVGTMVAAGAAIGLWWLLTGPTRRAVVASSSPVSGPENSKKEPPPVAVTIQKKENHYRIRSAHYEAIVEADGCLTSLRTGGIEFLRPGNGTLSRGSYFFDPGTQTVPALSTLEQPSADVLTATGEKGSIRYEFAADVLTWRLTNALDRDLLFYIVFDPAVTVVSNRQGEFAKLPQVREWPTTVWFAGRSKLTITGSTNIWGPWEKGYQVWQATLKPRETHPVVLDVGVTSDAEAAKVAKLTGASARRQAPPGRSAPGAGTTGKSGSPPP
jgi:serine/threonine protein kinase